MTREQMMSMSKEDLNVALTPVMGGFTKTNLKNTSKEKLVELLEEANAKAAGTKKKSKGTGEKGFASRGALAIVKKALLSGKKTIEQLADIVKKEEPDRDKASLINHLKHNVPSVFRKNGMDVQQDEKTGAYFLVEKK